MRSVPNRALVWHVGLTNLAVAAAGFAWGASVAEPAVAAAGAELAMLLRFMAVLKAAMALGAVSLVLWRLGHPVAPRLAVGYGLATAFMSFAPGLIWGLSHIIAGALLFHGGLGLFLALAWADRGVAVTLFAPARREPMRFRPLVARTDTR